MKERLLYLDCLKGIGIILMVFGHLEISQNILAHWIYAFHMPLFFIVSGVLWSVKDNVEDVSLKAVFKKRLFQLGVPYLIFCLIKILFYFLLAFAAHETCDWQDLLTQTFLLRGIGALWFFPCFFISELLLLISVKTKHILAILGLLVFVAIYSCFSYEEMKALGINVFVRGLLGFLIAWVGFKIGKFRLFDLNFFYGMLAIIIGSILGLLNNQVDMCTLQLHNVAFYSLSLALINVGFLSVLKSLSNCDRWLNILQKLSFWGINSIIVLCTHNILIEILRLIDYKLFDDRLKMMGLVGTIVLTLIVLLLELPIIYWGNRKFYFLFGKKSAVRYGSAQS